MKMVTVNKAQFAGLNDKRHYFSDEIVSFTYGCSLLLALPYDKKRNNTRKKFIRLLKTLNLMC